MKPQLDFQSLSAFVFDLDGVIWLGAHPIPGAADCVRRVRERGKALRFCTNNASLHRSAFQQKLQSMDIDCGLEEIITSGFAAARYLRERYGSGAKIHVMGSAGLMEEVRALGLELVERGAAAVVVGYDREFNWTKLDCAFQNIYEDGADFIACNMDKRYVEKDQKRPGTGATVASLMFCVEAEPSVIAGKPHQPVIDALFASLDCPPENAVLVGDKLYTDIACGKRAGMKTLLVRSGEGAEEEQKISAALSPDAVVDSVADLARLL